MKKLRILQTPIRFYPYIGGVEYHAYYLSEQLVKLGYDVSVICANEPKGKSSETLNGVKVKRLDYSFKIANTNISLGFPFALWRTDFDIAHTHVPTPWTADWTVLIAKLKNKPSILTIHSDIDKPDFIGKLMAWVYLHTFFKITLRLANKVIMVNPEWKITFKKTAHLFEPFLDKIITIPNAVDTQFFKPSEIKTKRNTILFVSVLDSYHRFKGFDYLLDAMPKIRQKIPDANLIVVGEGTLVNGYRKRARELGLENAVEFHGKKKQDELVHYYHSAKVFVLPSVEIEGFAIVPLEAMASGVPIVVTDVNGIAKEIDEFGAGKVVAARDSAMLADAIVSIFEDKMGQKKMGEQGRNLITQKFSLQTVTQDLSELYQEIS